MNQPGVLCCANPSTHSPRLSDHTPKPCPRSVLFAACLVMTVLGCCGRGTRATVLDPISIRDELYYDPQGGKLCYILEAGCRQSLECYDVQTGTPETIATRDEEDPRSVAEFTDKLSRIRSQTVTLRGLDLRACGLEVSPELVGLTGYKNDHGSYRGESDASVYEKFEWKLRLRQAEGELRAARLLTCAREPQAYASVRGYATPSADFAVLVITGLGICAEHGYTVDLLHPLPGLAVSTHYLVAGKPPSPLQVPLDPDTKRAKLVNSIGFAAYKEGEYAAAMRFFAQAHGYESGGAYLLPLYNLSATKALTGQHKRLFCLLDELLGFERSRSRYVAKIARDSDFDAVRHEPWLEQLLHPTHDERLELTHRDCERGIMTPVVKSSTPWGIAADRMVLRQLHSSTRSDNGSWQERYDMALLLVQEGCLYRLTGAKFALPEYVSAAAMRGNELVLGGKKHWTSETEARFVRYRTRYRDGRLAPPGPGHHHSSC